MGGGAKCSLVKGLYGIYEKSFTLAEVLIVLGILGLVADMTLPTLITNVRTKALETARQVNALKLEEVMNQMRANEKLTGYATADAFVKEFKNYMKTVSQCNSENLENCFPKKIKTAADVVETKDIKNGANIALTNPENYPSNNVGLTLPSGTMMILNYDKTCAWQNPFEGGGTNRQEATKCISAVYDVNGLKKPNKVGEDIVLLNAKLSSCDGVKIGGMCVSATNVSITPIDTCTDTTWDSSGSSNSYCANNYWAGAKKACSDAGMRLPTQAELAAIASHVYGTTIAAFQNYAGPVVNDIGMSGYWYWSSEHGGSYDAYGRYFNSGASNWGNTNSYYSKGQARCVR